MTRSIASTLALLLVAACAGGGDSTTTSSAATSTTSTSIAVSSTTTTGGATTTSAASDTTDPETPVTLPPVVARAVFAFTGGTTAAIRVTVEIAESPDGPWLLAGFDADPTPVLTGSNYWVRFTIENLDSLGSVVDVDISGFDNSDIGEDVCTLEEPIPVGGSAVCILPDGFSVEAGGAQNDFDSTGVGQRQGTEEGRYFQPPIQTPLGFDDAMHSFLFVFDTEEGVRIEGTSDGDEIMVDVDGFELAGPLRVDCSDLYPDGTSTTGGSPSGEEPALAAFVIDNFGSDGERRPGCADIPTVSLPFDSIGSDGAYLYETP